MMNICPECGFMYDPVFDCSCWEVVDDESL